MWGVCFRKGLQLLGYLVRERPSAAEQAVQLHGLLQLLGDHVQSEDLTVQAAALGAAADLAHQPSCLLAMKQVWKSCGALPCRDFTWP